MHPIPVCAAVLVPVLILLPVLCIWTAALARSRGRNRAALLSLLLGGVLELLLGLAARSVHAAPAPAWLLSLSMILACLWLLEMTTGPRPGLDVPRPARQCRPRTASPPVRTAPPAVARLVDGHRACLAGEGSRLDEGTP